MAALQHGTPAPPAGQPFRPPREHVTVGFAPAEVSRLAVRRRRLDRLAWTRRRALGRDFSLQLVRTAKIEGTVVVASGMSPQSVQLTMVPVGPHMGPGILGMTFLNRVTPGPDGKFSYAAVPPGQALTINAA